MNIFLKRASFLIASFLFCLPLLVLAQPGFDPGMTDGAPLDGGLSILAISGVVYGVNKYRNAKKKTSHTEDEVEK